MSLLLSTCKLAVVAAVVLFACGRPDDAPGYGYAVSSPSYGSGPAYQAPAKHEVGGQVLVPKLYCCINKLNIFKYFTLYLHIHYEYFLLWLSCSILFADYTDN